MTFHSRIRPNKESSLIDNQVKYDDKDFYDLLKVITTSTTRKSNMSIILKYFHSLSSFKNIISKIFPEINLLIQLLCENIEFEYSKANSILFRQHSVDEMMYVLIKGTLISLTKSSFKVMITKKEYLSYLIKLKLYNEDDLLKLTIENISNYEKYPLDIKDFSGIMPFPNEGMMKINDRSDLFTEFELGGDYKIMFDNIIHSTSKKNINRTRKSMFRFKLDKDLYKIVYNKCNEYNKINKYYLDRVSYMELDNNDNTNEKYMFILYKYIENGYFHRGTTFGNFLLESKDVISKESTIISKDNTYFGVLSKKLYKSLLIEANKRLMSQNIISLMKYSLFDKIKYKSFEHKINPNIEYKKLYRGDILGRQNEEISNIFFIKSGEFMIKFHGGYDDIYELLSKYSKYKVKYDLSFFEKYKKIMKDYTNPIKFNIKIVKDYGIFGFEDSCDDGRFLFDIVCYTNEGEVFYTNRKYFIENVILHLNHDNISNFHDTCIKNMQNIINLLEESLKFRVIKEKEKDYQLKEIIKKQNQSQSKTSQINHLSQENSTKIEYKNQVLNIKNIKKSNRNLILTSKINKNTLNYDKFMNKKVESYKKDVDSIIKNGIGMIFNRTRSISKNKHINNTMNNIIFQKEGLINKIDVMSSCNYNNKLYNSNLFSEKHNKTNEESSYYYNINTNTYNNNTYSNHINHTNNTYININNNQTNNIINSYYHFEKKDENNKKINDNHIESSLISTYSNRDSKQIKNIVSYNNAYKSMSTYKLKNEENLNKRQKMKLSNTFFIAHMIKRNINCINK